MPLDFLLHFELPSSEIDDIISDIEKKERKFIVKKIETIQDFKKFLNNNRDKLISKAVKVENLPPDDEWIQDDSWEEIYKKEVLSHEKI